MKVEERLALFQNQQENIRDLKANQWRFSHYGLLIQGALVYADSKLSDQGRCGTELVLALISFLGMLAAICLIEEAQKKIAHRRYALDLASHDSNRSLFSVRQEIIAGKTIARPQRWQNERLFRLLFFAVQFVGFVIAIWLIFNKNTACVAW